MSTDILELVVVCWALLLLEWNLRDFNLLIFWILHLIFNVWLQWLVEVFHFLEFIINAVLGVLVCFLAKLLWLWNYFRLWWFHLDLTSSPHALHPQVLLLLLLGSSIKLWITWQVFFTFIIFFFLSLGILRLLLFNWLHVILYFAGALRAVGILFI